MSQLEYRFQFATWTLANTLWIALTLIFIHLIFGQVRAIAGWTKDEVLLVATLNGIFSSLLYMFIIPSLTGLSDDVRLGNLDFYLIKPINARFLSSVNKYDIDNMTRVLALIGYLLFGIGIIHWSLSLFSLASFTATIVLGLVIFYNLFFLMATTSIWLIDLFNLDDLFVNLLNVGRFPVDIFTGSVKFLFTFVLPTAFIATFPALFLLQKGEPILIFYAAVVAIGTFLISQWFWNFALKKYSSASS